ncbi:C-X-C motif chemokine 9-like [Trematomus bernacchii]|uniref:C-X-C motif chemokine 9-like n=1 Tax=Trematomus bernacchii TaxID=40690 RepID=UPI00146A8E3E|nr:C-X-C motif chemokine 9-like [Trematomus bernacchii]
MNYAIQCIVFLACIITCTSLHILKCRCIKTSSSVNISLIADIKDLPPRPYCNKREVIVYLKDKRSVCLDPEGAFTQAVLRTIKRQKAIRAFKMNKTTAPPAPKDPPTSPKTTTASTTASVAPTWS